MTIKLFVGNDYSVNQKLRVSTVDKNGQSKISDVTVSRSGYITFVAPHFSFYALTPVDENGNPTEGITYGDIVFGEGGHTDEDNDGFCDKCGTPNDDPTKNCTCNCHKTGIIRIFWKIINFFRRIFGITKYRYCVCGKAHW